MYKSLFILPKGVSPTLTEDGWDFSSTNATISDELFKKIITNLNLDFDERYSSFEKYKNDQLEVVFKISKLGSVMRAMVKMYSCNEDELLSAIDLNFEDYDSYIFNPHRY